MSTDRTRQPIDTAALNQLYFEARTHNVWLDRPVSDETLKELHDLARWAPTSANQNPMRLIFVKSPEAKARLLPAVAPGNAEKVQQAPVTAIVAFDPNFFEHMPTLFPARDFKTIFAGMEAEARNKAARDNAVLQMGYLILAARALGLDCGPMAGFDASKVDAEFTTAEGWHTLYLINIGYGDDEKLFPRNPRHDFDLAARIV